MKSERRDEGVKSRRVVAFVVLSCSSVTIPGINEQGYKPQYCTVSVIEKFHSLIIEEIKRIHWD